MKIARFVIISLVGLGGVACDKAAQPVATEEPVVVPSTPATAMTISAAPRYQIVFSPLARADTYLIDTQKGRVWQQTEFTSYSGKPMAFSEVDVIDDKGEIGITSTEFAQLHQIERSADSTTKSPPDKVMSLEDFAAWKKQPEPCKETDPTAAVSGCVPNHQKENGDDK